jgi:CRISPR-associated protein Cmr4
MFTSSDVMFLHAETSVHLGSGQSRGAVDLAVQRERHTGFPVGAASSVKGAVRSWFRDRGEAPGMRKAVFGPDTDNASAHAGAVAFTDARILLFPVRSMKGVFAWVTCPAVLRRLRRDLDAAGGSVSWDVPDPGDEVALGTEDCANATSKSEVLLEERHLSFQQSDDTAALATWLGSHAIPDAPGYGYWHESARERLLVVADDVFRDFTRFSTEVQARVKLNEDGTTGEGGNLFYQENLPSDSLFYSVVLAQDDLSGEAEAGSADDLVDFVRTLDGNRFQIGGDASVGRGLTHVHFANLSSNPANGQ